MKNYGTYTTEQLPEIEIVRSGNIYQIMFNFEDVEHIDEEGIESDSQKHYMCDLIEVATLDYASIVSAIIREKYSQDDVEAILSNYQLCKDGEAGEDRCIRYEEDYNAYQDYRAMAKQVANQIINL